MAHACRRTKQEWRAAVDAETDLRRDISQVKNQVDGHPQRDDFFGVLLTGFVLSYPARKDTATRSLTL